MRAHVAAHLGSRITRDDLAAAAGVSRFHFARQFRRSTGESPLGYVLRTRVQRGKVLLRDRGATVARVAAELGFADQSHFARTFRLLVGESPTRFADHLARGVASGVARDE